MYYNFLDTIPHKRRGDEFQFIDGCPFCGQEKPGDTRIYYNAAKDIGICFHCDKRFRLPQYISALNGVSIREAFEILREEGCDFRRSAVKAVKSNVRIPDNLVEIRTSSEASGYCARRGISDFIIHDFNLKYIPEDFTQSYFGRRIFIPVFDSKGELGFWQGRDITGKAQMKYLFPKGADKSQYVFNLHKIPYNADYVILCEGVMDVFGWVKANKAAVALFGKHMSKRQYELILSRGAKNIYVALDSDALKNSTNIQKKLGQAANVKFIYMNKDADECSKYELEELFQSASEYSWENSILTLVRHEDKSM